MAEKKHNIVAAQPLAAADGKEVTQAKPVGNSKGLRIGAIVLWAAALAFEILGILVILGKLHISFIPSLAQLILFIVLDLACVIIGAQL